MCIACDTDSFIIMFVERLRERVREHFTKLTWWRLLLLIAVNNATVTKQLLAKQLIFRQGLESHSLTPQTNTCIIDYVIEERCHQHYLKRMKMIHKQSTIATIYE
jgi:hypothetical protein